MKFPQSKIGKLGVAVSTLLAISTTALAASGGSDRGGADSQFCSGFLHLFGNKKATLADIVVLNSEPDFKYVPDSPEYFNSLTDEQITAGIMNVINHVPNHEGVLQALNRLTFKLVPDVNELNTGFTPSIPQALWHGCEKVQLATQDFDTGVVSIAEPIYDMLTPIERALLRVHEAYVNLYHQSETDLSIIETKARKSVRDIWLGHFDGGSPTDFGILVLQPSRRNCDFYSEHATYCVNDILNLMVPPHEVLSAWVGVEIPADVYFWDPSSLTLGELWKKYRPGAAYDKKRLTELLGYAYSPKQVDDFPDFFTNENTNVQAWENASF